MTTPREVLDRVIRCFNEQDRDGWMALASPEIEAEGQSGQAGLDVWSAILDMFREGLPDIRLEAVSNIESDSAIATEMRITATHTGVLRMPGMVEVPPTGKHVDFVYADFHRMVGDHIVYSRGYGFESPLAQQLGLVSFQPATQNV